VKDRRGPQWGWRGGGGRAQGRDPKGERGVSPGIQRVNGMDFNSERKVSGRIHRVYGMGAERERRCPNGPKR
jgi:hypothetical protein